jgi:hypothetical protein
MAASDTMWQLQGSFGSSGSGTMQFRQGYAGSWGTWLSIITSANIGSQSVSYATSAGSISGYNNPTTGATANTIVYRDGSGDIYGRYGFYSYVNTSDDASTGTISYIMAKFGDNYHRSASAAKVASFISGQSMNISGNASTASSASYATTAGSANAVAWGNVISKPAAWLDATNLTGNSAPNTTSVSGFYNDYASSGNPVGTWFSYVNVRHENPSNVYGHQHGMSFYDNNFWFRSYAGGTYQSWSRALGTQTDPYPSNMNQYVRTSDYVSFANITISTSGTASDWYANGWFRNNNQFAGLYSQYHVNHWYATSSTDWNIGSTGSTAAILFRTGGHQGPVRGYVYANDSNQIGFLNSGGNWSLRMDNSGNLTATGDVTAYSDARVKENIITVDNALSKVLSLRGVYYNRIDTDDKKRKIGVIAQETLTVVPEVVNNDNKGMFNVAYGNLGGLFIE